MTSDSQEPELPRAVSLHVKLGLKTGSSGRAFSQCSSLLSHPPIPSFKRHSFYLFCGCYVHDCAGAHRRGKKVSDFLVWESISDRL